ncbi:MAG: polyhydroxyalkanoic acid system family protein [Betaproteobacteria bacterium]|nr:polyhydroxyalkanoic acid system family protein [Betaproteobacteria bacterium]
MADIDITRNHDLGMKAARDAADRMVEDLGKKFGLSGGWTGNTHHFDRPGVTGSLHLTDKHLHLTVTLGFLLKMMRAPLEAAIVRELDSLFEKHAGKTGPKPARGPAEVATPVKKPASPKSGSGGRKKAG